MKIEAGPRRDMEVDPQKQEWNVDENGKETKDYQEGRADEDWKRSTLDKAPRLSLMMFVNRGMAMLSEYTASGWFVEKQVGKNTRGRWRLA